jgi:hypothetical protein
VTTRPQSTRRRGCIEPSRPVPTRAVTGAQTAPSRGFPQFRWPENGLGFTSHRCWRPAAGHGRFAGRPSCGFQGLHDARPISPPLGVVGNPARVMEQRERAGRILAHFGARLDVVERALCWQALATIHPAVRRPGVVRLSLLRQSSLTAISPV